MKVGYITQWFDPERGSAAQAGNIARSLERQGLEVTTLTGFPNYPEGSIYPGYKLRPHMTETRDGMRVDRVPLIPTHRPSALSRLANYGSFAAASSLAAPVVLRDVDAVLVHLTPATTATAALTLKRLRGIPYVLHVQDLWPDTVTSSGFLHDRATRHLEDVLHRYCDMLYRHASAIAVTSPGMADKIAARGIDRADLHFAPNWADEAVFTPMETDEEMKARWGLRPFTVMYAGNLGEFQTLDTLLDVARATADLTHVGYAIVGEGVREGSLRARVAQQGLTNVKFLGAQPFDAMAKVLALGDLHYVGLQDLPLFRLTIPSKVQATMAAARPILGALRGDAAAVIDASGAGSCHTPGDVEGLAATVRSLSAGAGAALAAGQAARAYYDAHFSEEASSAVLASLLRSAAREETVNV